MNLDELKISWKVLDERLLASHKLNEQLIITILKQRSKDTLTTIKRGLIRIAAFFIGLLFLFGAILLGNPFDYESWPEYMPAVLYTGLVVRVLLLVIHQYQQIRGITLTSGNLRESLLMSIEIHEKYRHMMNTLWRLSLVIGFLFALSLSGRHFEQYGLTKSLLVIGGQALTTWLLYRIAKWVILSRPDPVVTELNSQLTELDELSGS